MSDDLNKNPMRDKSQSTNTIAPQQVSSNPNTMQISKFTLKTIILCIVVATLAVCGLWYFNKTTSYNTVNKPLANEPITDGKEQKPVEKTKTGVETTQIDSIWNKYTNYDLGISFNYPNFTTVMIDQGYNKPSSSKICVDMKDRSKSSDDCDLSVTVGENVKTDSEIIRFFNKVLSSPNTSYQCSQIGKKTPYNQIGVNSIDFQSNFDDEITETNYCFVNWRYLLLSNQNTGQIAYWNMGQDIYILYKNITYDSDIVNSFRFLD